MNKIVSNVLIVSTQLIVGGLFLFMLFSDNNEGNRVVVVENNNLDKMADAVSELFVVDHAVVEDEAKKQQEEEELKAAEEQRRLEEEAKAREEEAARLAQEEAERKAQEEALKNQVVMNANGYISKPALGFNVTTGNRAYALNNGEFSIVSSVVACEAVSKDDALAVMSVILNRADARGISPVAVVAQAGQFSCYSSATGTGKGDPSRFASVVKDALDGIRNNSYHSFNGMYSGVSENYIVSNGNRFF